MQVPITIGIGDLIIITIWSKGIVEDKLCILILVVDLMEVW